MEKKKNTQIEGLRGIGCITMVLVHLSVRYFSIYYGGLYTPPFYKTIINFADWGLTVFLVISAWFFVQSKSKPKANGSTDTIIFRRLLKLWCPYVVSISITFTLSRFLNLGDRIVSFKNYLINVTMLQEFVVDAKSVDSAHWYLTTMIVFTIVVMVIENNFKYKRTAYFLWLLIGIISSLCEIRINGKLLQREYLGIIISTIMVRYMYDDYSKGNLGAMLKKDWQNIVIWCIGIGSTYYYKDWRFAVFTVTGQIILLLCLAGYLKVLDNRVLAWLGAISYPLYLIHQNVSYMIMNSLTDWLGTFHYWYIAVAVVIVLLLAPVIQFIGKYILKYITSLCDKAGEKS